MLPKHDTMSAPLPHPAAHKLLLIPGLLCTAKRLFAHQLPFLRRLPLHLHFGKQDASPAIATIAQELVDQHCSSAGKPLAIAGLSFGGYVALEMLRLAPPGSISHLCLLSSQARADSTSTAERRKLQIQRVQRDRCISGILKEQLPILLRKDLVPSDLEAFAAQRPPTFPVDADEATAPPSETPAEVVRHMAYETGPDSFITQQQAIMSREDRREVLREAVQRQGLRLSIITGQEDTLIPVAVARQLYSFVLGDSPSEELQERVSFTIAARAGHLVTLERPEETTRAMVRWLGYKALELEGQNAANDGMK